MRSFFVLYLLSAVRLMGATVATDGSLSDVQSKHDTGISAGDTLTIPAGGFNWTGTLTWTQACTIQGAGTNLTFITNSQTAFVRCVDLYMYAGGAGAVGLPALTYRFTGVTWVTNASIIDHLYGVFVIQGRGTNDNARFRLDHMHFDQLQRGGYLVYGGFGVIDHCRWTLRAAGQLVGIGFARNNLWGNYNNTYGDAAWASDMDWSSDRFVFFEDNVVTNLYPTSEITGFDGLSGGRIVIRHSDLHAVSAEWHGLEDTRDRSMQMCLIYSNVFRGKNVRASPIYGRGGNCLVYSNQFPGWSASSTLNLLNNRGDGALGAPFAGSSGKNVWDTNSTSSPFDTCTATSAGSYTVTDNTKVWTLNQWVGYHIKRTSGKAIPSGGITRSGSTVTVNTSAAHGFSNGDIVSIWGANEYVYDGNIFGGITVVDSDTFTFSDVNANLPTGTGSSIKCAVGAPYAQIDSNTTGGAITYSSGLYGAAYDLQLTTGDTYEINFTIASMDQPGRGGGPYLNGDFLPTFTPVGTMQTNFVCSEWQNDLNGGDIDFSNGRTGGSYASIVNGRNYTNDTVYTFTPYTYPHPLVSGQESPASPTPVISATGLRGINLKAK